MNPKNHSKVQIGILGGGQLARMLYLEGQNMGLCVHVLSESKDDPAAQVCKYWHRGSPNDARTLSKFLKKMNYVTFESEFINAETLKKAAVKLPVKIFPKIKDIALFSDRLSQKSWLKKFNIPTAQFQSLKNSDDLIKFQPNLQKGIVIKARRNGYDGKGTYIIRNKLQLNNWLKLNALNISDFIIEDYIPFHRELAVQFAVNQKKEVCVFPLVEWQAENSQCKWVMGPIKPSQKYQALIRKISSALKKSNYVGFIAFELFEYKGSVLVNEVAPRVHNSAHYSIEALNLNQFQAHLSSVLNYKLPKSPQLIAPGFAMLNLIGGKFKNNKISLLEHTALINKTYIHWYGKKDAKIGRKMGHLTSLANSPQNALRELFKTERILKK
ncbi:MAG: 5-(carboxyamino)imidazole ribonucleotide synthase [Bdellovibrionales bacterium]